MNNATIMNEYKLEHNMDLSEPLYTYKEWQRIGYNVKKGEESHHKISIWKYSCKIVKNDETGEEEKVGRCFLRVASFFTKEQVERIKEDKSND